MVSVESLAQMQGALNTILTTPCTLSRAGALLSPQPTMPDGSPLRCLIAADSRESNLGITGAIVMVQRWVITLPAGLDVRIEDEITALGSVYTVSKTVLNQTVNVSSTVYAYLLGGSGSGDAASGFRITACTIQRKTPTSDSMGGQTATWATLATTTCRVMSQNTTDQETIAEDRIRNVTRWLIAFAPGTAITARDRVLALGNTYEVIAVLGPTTYELERIVQCALVN